ncbi:MAG: DMT family transporter [Betaproteobacteria bacterium]|nr:DMT family transporter [Betaproteobacteria bacterium]
MLVAGALFAIMGAFAKSLAGQFTGAELSFYRCAVGLIAVGAFVIGRRQSLVTPFWKGHFWRGLTGTISLIAYFYAMTKLPLATAITLNYTSPIWLTLLSTALLRERFQPRLLLAIALGFVGVVLLLRPTLTPENLHDGLIGLASGFFAACAYINVKKLGDAGEPEWRVVFYFAVAGSVGSGLLQAALGDFHPVTMPAIGPLLGMGLCATLAQLAMTRAYHSGNTLVVGAFAYSTVIFASLAGIFWFDELLPPLAWVGMAIIIFSGLLAKRVSSNKPALPVEAD